jgi:hypothetical protein
MLQPGRNSQWYHCSVSAVEPIGWQACSSPRGPARLGPVGGRQRVEALGWQWLASARVARAAAVLNLIVQSVMYLAPHGTV